MDLYIDRFYAYRKGNAKPLWVQVDKGFILEFHNDQAKVCDGMIKKYKGHTIHSMKSKFEHVIPARIDVLIQISKSFRNKIADYNDRLRIDKLLQFSHEHLEGERNKLIVKVSQYEQKMEAEIERIFRVHGFIYEPHPDITKNHECKST
jgi:hypothetical protein